MRVIRSMTACGGSGYSRRMPRSYEGSTVERQQRRGPGYEVTLAPRRPSFQGDNYPTRAGDRSAEPRGKMIHKTVAIWVSRP